MTKQTNKPARNGTATEPGEILLTRETTAGDPMADYAVEGAAHWLPVYRSELAALKTSWRTCCDGAEVDTATLNKARVHVWDFPQSWQNIGADNPAAKGRRSVAIAVEVLMRLLRRALSILARAALERGDDPAPFELALRAMDDDGAAWGFNSDAVFPETLPPADRERLRLALARLNHAAGMPAERPDKKPAPARNTDQKSEPKKPPFSEKVQSEVADLWHAARSYEGKPPLRRNFFAEHAGRLRGLGIDDTGDVKRCLDAARKNDLLNRWNKNRRKTDGKGCQV